MIYIDPPYNTGARDWTYNNNYIDAEDPYRHSKWISFMNKRLQLAKNLLSTSGIICCTIDDYESSRLLMLMDDIFGEKNHLGTVIIRNNPKGRKTNRKVSLTHEYAVFYGKTTNSKIQKMPVKIEDKSHSYKQDIDGTYYLEVNLRKQGVDSLAKNKKGRLSKRYYPIYFDPIKQIISTTKKLPIKIMPIDKDGEKRIWRRSKEDVERMYRNKEIWYKKTKFGNQIYFKFRGGLDGEPPQSIWNDSKFSASEHGTRLLDEILGAKEKFAYPKSPYAVEDCIKIMSKEKKLIVLDFFAGSGTTGHSVLQLNKADGGNRKFILCTNNEKSICTDVCYPRLKNVIRGYKTPKGDKMGGLGGALKYFKTEFIDSAPTDANKKKLVDYSTEMLCMKENCFEEVNSTKYHAVFSNSKKILVIVYGDEGIKPAKKIITKMDKLCIVYVFSFDEYDKAEEFEEIKHLVKLKPVPVEILNLYGRLFR